MNGGLPHVDEEVTTMKRDMRRRRNYLRGLGRTVLGGVLLGRLSGFHRFSGFSLLPMFLVHFSRGRSLLCWHVTARLDIGWDLG